MGFDDTPESIDWIKGSDTWFNISLSIKFNVKIDQGAKMYAKPRKHDLKIAAQNQGINLKKCYKTMKEWS